MTRSSIDYIQQVAMAIRSYDGVRLGLCLTINPGQEEGLKRAKYLDPSDFDLHQLSDAYRDVVRAHLKLMRQVYLSKDINEAFDALNSMVVHLIRAANDETNWINAPLINSCIELVTVYKVKQSAISEERALELQDQEEGDDHKPSSLEMLTETMNRAFKLSLNDKNLDMNMSKRLDLYFFLGVLIQLYFKQGKMEMAKSVDKVVKGSRFKLPDLSAVSKSRKYAVSYLYYSAILSLDEADFFGSEKKLAKALDILAYYKGEAKRSIEKILLILLPLNLLNRNLVPREQVWRNYPTLKLIYKDNLFDAVNSGNLLKYRKTLERFEGLFLKKNLYLLIEHLKRLCQLKLIQKTTSIFRSLNMDSKANHIVPFSAYQVALGFSENYPSTSSVEDRVLNHPLEEIECIFANLIAESKIKGYLSHGNKCVVFSKTNPFPQDHYKWT